MAQRHPEKSFGPVAGDVRQNYEPGMDFVPRDEVAEVSGVLCDEDKVLVDATGQHAVVGIAQPAVIPRMEYDMVAFVVESEGNVRRKALVQEQAHRTARPCESSVLGAVDLLGRGFPRPAARMRLEPVSLGVHVRRKECLVGDVRVVLL